MNNTDMPANPINADYRVKVNGVCLTGLTKREHFAGLAMQGILAGVLATATPAQASQVAKDAVNDADALLKELEK